MLKQPVHSGLGRVGPAPVDQSASAERGGITPAIKALTPEQQKIQELEARIMRLEREKSILKKATALLMSEDLERRR